MQQVWQIEERLKTLRSSKAHMTNTIASSTKTIIVGGVETWTKPAWEGSPFVMGVMEKGLEYLHNEIEKAERELASYIGEKE